MAEGASRRPSSSWRRLRAPSSSGAPRRAGGVFAADGAASGVRRACCWRRRVGPPACLRPAAPRRASGVACSCRGGRLRRLRCGARARGSPRKLPSLTCGSLRSNSRGARVNGSRACLRPARPPRALRSSPPHKSPAPPATRRGGVAFPAGERLATHRAPARLPRRPGDRCTVTVRAHRRTHATHRPHEGGCARDAQRLRGAEERKAGRPARRRSLRASSSCFAATVRAE